MQPNLTRNWKTDSPVLLKTPLFSKNGNRRYKYLVLGHEETYFAKEHSDSKNKFSESDMIKMLEFLFDMFSRFLPEKSSSRQSAFQWVQIVALFLPKFSYVFIRSGFHTDFALNGRETVIISVQSHLQLHRWCIVHKQARIRKLSGADVSCWAWE